MKNYSEDTVDKLLDQLNDRKKELAEVAVRSRRAEVFLAAIVVSGGGEMVIPYELINSIPAAFTLEVSDNPLHREYVIKVK